MLWKEIEIEVFLHIIFQTHKILLMEIMQLVEIILDLILTLKNILKEHPQDQIFVQEEFK